MNVRSDFPAALRALRHERAPQTLAAAVNERLGLRHTYVRIATEIGDVYVASGKEGVVSVRRAKDAAAYEAWHARAFGHVPRLEPKPPKAELDRLRRGLAGGRSASIRVDLRGRSAFARAVLEKTREIPRGEVRPYAWVAKAIGRPKAVRAVGSALAKNPVPLLIPCHRVVRSDGHVGRYIFGSPAKRALLAFEGTRIA